MKTQHIFIQYYHSPYGILMLGSFGDQLVLCDWQYRKMRAQIDHRLQKALNAKYVEKETSTIQLAQKQLEEYFSKQRKYFKLKLLPIGSAFQKQVWQALLNIPYGKTSSYLDLAKSIGKSSAIRAVAAANGANALSIVIPCHRVIGSNGKLRGYAGGLSAKRKILGLENDHNKTKQLHLF